MEFFFADVAMPARSTGGKEAMFADDLNVFQEFDRQTPLPEVMSKLSECRKRVHEWGSANRVTFDAGKEHLVVLHPSESHGDPFKLLGCMVDPDLRMHTAIEQLLSKIRSKSTAILRTRAYFIIPLNSSTNIRPMSGDWLSATAGLTFMLLADCWKKSPKFSAVSCQS